MQRIKIGQLLKRIKESITLEDNAAYKRVTIRTKNQGISLRDVEIGINIGTKKQFLVRNGQFLLSKIDARHGAFGIVPKNLDRAIITGNFWTFEVNKELLNIEWFNIFVSSPYFIDICSKASSGTTNRLYLDENKFLDFELVLPNLVEQGLFVQKYKSINYKFEMILKQLVKQQIFVRKLRESILLEGIQGSLVKQNENDEPAFKVLERIKLIKDNKKEKLLPQISDIEKPFKLPKGWEWTRLGNVISLLSDYHANGSYKILKENVNLLDTEDYAIMVRITNLGNNPSQDFKYITKEAYEFLKKSKLQPNDIVMSKITDPGTVYIVPDLKKPMSLAMNLFMLRFHDTINSKYIYYYLKARESYVKSFQGGTSTKTITKDAVKGLILALPPLEEQKRIVDKIDHVMALCDELELNIEQSKLESDKLIKAVLQEAFTVKEEVLG